MNEKRTEPQLRRHLQARANAGEDIATLRNRARQQLDAIEGGPHRQATPTRTRGLAVAASVVMLVGALGVGLSWSQSRSDQTGNVATPETLPPSTPLLAAPAGEAIDTSALRIPLSLFVPDAVENEVVTIASNPQLIELSLDGPTTADPPLRPTLRIIVTPAGSTTESIADDVTLGLADTELVEIADDQLGERSTRVIRLESDLGSTVVGFKIGSAAFITASGVDRQYEAHVIDAGQDVIVVWIDATRDRFDEARRDADLIVSTLQLG